MAATLEDGKEEVAKLVGYFRTNMASFHASGFKEAHARQTLIDPFFIALGWDVRNEKHIAPQYREVIPEESLEVEGHRKAPDYSFRVGQTAKFFAEAKRPDANLKDDPRTSQGDSPIFAARKSGQSPTCSFAGPYQLRRYSWSAKLPLAVLTSFEELAVYESQTRPSHSDKAGNARIWYHTFEEYPDCWRKIWDVFSREAVWSGAFDRFTESQRGKRGTTTVDTEFLKEIDSWRDVLARNMALRNPKLSSDDLNKAVQLTIDRIIFLRMAEDRGVEQYERLLKLTDKTEIYRHFIKDVCRLADSKYNSGLFHFEEEEGVESEPDRLTPRLAVDDKVLKPILNGLYFPQSPYEFRAMPVEILGDVYEQFLGKVIRLTTGHQAKVKEKPEVRKAGGVYYTPAYIVAYIVRNSVGAMIEGKSPAQLAGDEEAKRQKGSRGQRGRGPDGQPFRVLDMACGSGSFLLGAYQFLMDHCLKWYLENTPEKHTAAVWKPAAEGSWRLTIGERKRLLTTHIFGVDIDAQAVEVSKLSLLLKVLEGENDETLGRQTQMRLFHERALPNLDQNIKCGNSLIGSGYFAGRLPLDPEEARRVNAFDWKTGFPDATAAGGFDCIIGNPPYVRIQVMKEWAAREVEIYKELYRSAREGNYDIYVVFLERGLELLNPTGRLGFICPHKFFNAKYGAPLRSVVAEGQHLSRVVHFGDQQVFDGATTYTCLLFLDKPPAKQCQFFKVDDLAAWRASGVGSEGVIHCGQVTASEWNFVVGNGTALYEKLSQMPDKLAALASNIAQGIRTSANEIYVLDGIAEVGDLMTAHSKKLNRDVKLERNGVYRFLQGREIKPFAIFDSGKVVIVPYAVRGGHACLLSESDYQRQFPRVLKYLRENKDALSQRERGRMRGSDWYAYIYPKNLAVMKAPKILVPDIADRASFAFDEAGEYAFTSGYGITLKPAVQESPKYLLGLLNSRLLDFHLKRTSTTLRGGFFRYFTQFVEQLPIRRIDFSTKADMAAHDRMVRLVDSMLALHRQLATINSEAQRVAVQRQIEATDAEINRLVYELYGLTDEEIAIVEEAAK